MIVMTYSKTFWCVSNVFETTTCRQPGCNNLLLIPLVFDPQRLLSTALLMLRYRPLAMALMHSFRLGEPSHYPVSSSQGVPSDKMAQRGATGMRGRGVAAAGSFTRDRSLSLSSNVSLASRGEAVELDSQPDAVAWQELNACWGGLTCSIKVPARWPRCAAFLPNLGFDLYRPLMVRVQVVDPNVMRAQGGPKDTYYKQLNVFYMPLDV